MADVITYQRFWQRRDTAANWASSNPVLAAGEIGVELTALPAAHLMKIGDGTTAWNSLPYFGGGAGSNTGVIGCTFDGGGAVIAPGAQCDVLVPFDCTITKATLLADQSGSVVIAVWSDAYASYPPTIADSITSSTPPTISSAAKSEDATLTGWSTAITAGTTLRFNVNSCTTITRVLLSLEVLK